MPLGTEVIGRDDPVDVEVVFVHLGSSAPAHLDIAVAQARLLSSRVTVILDPATGEEGRFPGADRVNALGVLSEDDRGSFRRSSQLDGTFRHGFWLWSALRLVALGRYAASRPWPVLHLENDVVLYMPPRELLGPTRARAVWMPIVSGSHVSAAVLLIRQPHGGSLLAEQILSAATNRELSGRSEMEVLARVTADHRGLIGLLPRVPSGPAFSYALRCLPLGTQLADLACGDIQMDWVFDPGVCGQYLGGFDPRNLGEPEARPAGFALPAAMINELDVIEPARIGFGLIETGDAIVPGIVCGDVVVRLANLHVHSKNLAPFTTEAARSAWRSDRCETRRLPSGEEVAWLTPRVDWDEWTKAGVWLARATGRASRRVPHAYSVLRRAAVGPVGHWLGLRHN